MKIFLIVGLVYLAISLGVYIKLISYKAPKTSIIYAPFIPLVSLILATKSLIDQLKKVDNLSLKFKILLFILIEIKIIIENYSYSGIMCALLGASKIGALQILMILKNKISNNDGIFRDIKDVINTEVKIEDEVIYKKILNIAF